MVERYRRGRSKKKLLGNHQKCWIWGRNPVLETLRAGWWTIHELRLADALSGGEISAARRLGQALDVPVTVESAASLSRCCRSREHQGYLAKMAPYPYAEANEVLSRKPVQPFYVILDRIQDPYNFGAIVRSANGLGVDGLFVAKREQVKVTSLVARSSAGAVNYVDICELDDLASFANELRRNGVRTVAASEAADRPLFECDFRQPTALIIGSEGHGIADGLLDACDCEVAIPQCGNVSCLNAAVSAGILLYEVRRQRFCTTAVQVAPARKRPHRGSARWSE